MENLEKDVLTGCFLDQEDIRDYDVADWGDTDLEIKIPPSMNLLDNCTLDSQGRSVKCTAYALMNVCEIEIYRIFGQKVSLDADWQWNNQSLIDYPTKSANGDSLRSALQAAMQFGVKIKEIHSEGVLKVGDIIQLEGFAKVAKTAEAIKAQIAQGKGIYTACNTTKPMEKGKEAWTTWTYAKKTGYINLRGARVGGHAWIIGGYDERNNNIDGTSYGEEYGFFKDGSFRNYEEQLSQIATMYVIYLKEDQLINSAEKARAIRLSKTLWILANKLSEDERINPIIENELKLIKQNAHNAAEIMRKLG